MSSKTIHSKYSELLRILSDYGDLALAFSGGKDSVLLLKAGVDALGVDKVVGMTAVSPIRRDEEREFAGRIGRRLAVPVEFVNTREYKDKVFIENPTVERCFVCKAELFANLKRVAERRGFRNLADGTNLDDSLEDRPVFAVGRRYGIRWPLVEAEIAGDEVAALLTTMGLPEYARAHYSCSAWDVVL